MKSAFGTISFLLAVFFLSAETQAQMRPNSREIPADLLITLKEQGGWGGSLSELTINAKGEVSNRIIGGLPVKNQLSIGNKPKMLRPYVPPDKIRFLLAEFERIQFHRFGSDFPVEEKKKGLFITDQGTQTISIRMNAQVKEVSNYLGESSERSEILRHLAARIRSAQIWNYENGEIPGDFWIRYSTQDAGKIWDAYIFASGKVIEGVTSIRYFQTKEGTFSNRLSGPKPVGKVPNATIRKLMDEFERAGFSTFQTSKRFQFPCTNILSSRGDPITSISVQINTHNHFNASVYHSCDSQPDPNLDRFESLEKVLRELLKSVGGLGG
jgi:hypothetical protein